MISGRQTLSNIDQTVTDARARIAAIESQIEGVNRRLAELQQALTQDYKDLAQVRVGMMTDPETLRHLDQAERQALALLSQRESALRELETQLQSADTLRQTLERERSAQAARLDAADAAVDAAAARTQARLDADPDYRRQREKATEAERLAMHASEKATRSEEEREQKGAAFRGDPLFLYLWERNHGTPEDKSWGLFRALDGWVAKRIGFADARANYSRLNEIPERLREHARGLQAGAESEFAALKALDEAARAEDGIPALERIVADEQARLDAIDARIAKAESDQQILMARRALFAAGEDEHTKQAVNFMAAEFQREDLMELRREALATPYPEDDLIVSRMLQREDERRQLAASIQGLKDAILQQQKRLTELEALRSDFKRSRYDRTGSTFGDGDMIAMLLGQFVNGMLDRDNLWRILREQQRYRPQQSDPTFGSGGYGRGTVWGGGSGGLSDIVGSFGRGSGGGRGGGGGFRTGGGF
ncbi:hypothetical protein CCR95_04685 [Thiocystis minor]|uniref:hypothetical protein n=1 Tax=Thiocystis minor TaxID=61597 RepID=UPI001912EBEB|nr:hypothetical protein [Thiocystis minor]MBK5963405.1 hypothetical protein [Thiocystis minor]